MQKRQADKQIKLTLPLVLRDLVPIVVCIVPFILDLIHTQGCTQEAKHAQHAPDPEHMHDKALFVLLLKNITNGCGYIRCACHPVFELLSPLFFTPSPHVQLFTLSQQLLRVLSL